MARTMNAVCAWIPGCIPVGTGTWTKTAVRRGVSSLRRTDEETLTRRNSVLVSAGAQWRACTSSSDGIQVSRRQVVETAQLARLDIQEEEIEQVSDEFQNIIQLFNKLSDVDVEGVEPMARPHDSENVIRPDTPSRFDQVDELLEQAPLIERDFVRVPKIGGEPSD